MHSPRVRRPGHRASEPLLTRGAPAHLPLSPHGHALSTAVTLAALTNITQYVYWKGHVSKRKGTHWRRHGPTYLCALSVPLVMLDLTRHLLQDADIWTGPSSSMYRPNCDDSGLGGLTCLSWTGFLFTIVGTYAGFAMLLTGVFWSAGFVGKVKRAWALARKQ